LCGKKIRETASLSQKRQHIKVPLISVVDDDRSVVEAMANQQANHNGAIGAEKQRLKETKVWIRQ
jgi:hypothetical protein